MCLFHAQRKTRRYVACVLASVALVGTQASAQDVYLIGLGSNSCGKWLESKANASARAVYRSPRRRRVQGRGQGGGRRAPRLFAAARPAHVLFATSARSNSASEPNAFVEARPLRNDT